MKISIVLIVVGIQQALAGGFIDTCSAKATGTKPGTTIMHSECKREDGSTNYTELELNNCFNNNNGGLYVS